MATERLIFDPDGDLRLRLRYIEEKDEDKEVKNNNTVPFLGNFSDTTSESSAEPVTEPVFTPIKYGLSELKEGDAIKEVEMLVSAKHLMLASPVFYAMFKYNFLEGDTLRSTGRVEVPLPDDDAGASKHSFLYPFSSLPSYISV